MLRTVFIILAFLLWSSVAHAEKRVALVIGNGAYQKVDNLPNPTNDAKAIAEMLRAAGFDEVMLYENLGFRQLRQAIKDFSNLALATDTAVVYYSGHGIEVNGVNYLIPTDAVLDSDIDVPYETYSLDNLVEVLEPARRLRLVMLDACRENPFARSMKRKIASRAVGRGLAPVEPTTMNTLIGFAAKAGSIALDGDGLNSPYATALLNHITTPGLDLRIAFGRVRDEVLNGTRNKQEPFVYGSLGGMSISLVPAPSALNAPRPEEVRANYEMAERINTEAAWEAFLRTYNTGYHVELARERLRLLQEATVAAKRKAEEEAVAKAEAEARAKAQRSEEERIAAEKRAAEERARREAEAKGQVAAEAAKKKAEEETLTKRQQEERIAAERREAEERARREAEANRQAAAELSKKKTGDIAVAASPPEAEQMKVIEAGKVANIDTTTSRQTSPDRGLVNKPRPIRLGYHASFDGNCRSLSLPSISIISGPRNGKIEFRTEVHSVKRAQFVNCIGTTHRHRVIYYVPFASPVTSERVSYLVRNPTGNTMRVDCSINPLARTAECKWR